MKALLVPGLVVSLFAVDARAEEVSPQKAAEVGRDRQKALDDVSKKYGGRKPSELSSEERRERVKDESAAVSKVMEQHGVNAKDLARYEATSSPKERAAASAKVEAAEKKQAEERAEAQKAQAAPAGAAGAGAGTTVENGVIIERGPQPGAKTDEQTKPSSRQRR